MLPADAEKIPEPGDQGGAAVHKGEKVHVPVGTGVIPVHQAGLWRSRYLIEQGADGCRRCLVGRLLDVYKRQIILLPRTLCVLGS